MSKLIVPPFEKESGVQNRKWEVKKIVSLDKIAKHLPSASSHLNYGIFHVKRTIRTNKQNA